MSSSSFGALASIRVLAKPLSIALAFTVAILVVPSAAHAETAADERMLTMHNIHTQEDIRIVYKRDGEYVPEALTKLDYFMRDWRRNATIKIDPELYDIIWQAHKELGSKKPINLICGHRSSATNEGLRRTRGGQARGSLHITGQAADIQFPDIPIKQLRNSALIIERGGVGYYPSSSIPFVHVDTGKVRHWPRMPRQELAILFPAGRSKHVPVDGQPLTKADFRIALAALREKGGEMPWALQNRTGGSPSTVLASYAPDTQRDALGDGNGGVNTASASAPMPSPKPKAQLVLASLTPSFDRSEQQQRMFEPVQPKPAASGKAVFQQEAPVEEKTVVRPRMQLTSAKPDADLFTRDFVNGPAARQPASEPEYDEDELSDDLEYQPYPVIPYITDTPLAHIDFTTSAPNIPLSMVHVLFGETREMLDTPFQGGLQVAHLFWAQRFQGTAVNTAVKRVARDTSAPQPVKTAQSGGR